MITEDDDGPVVRLTSRCPACRTALPIDAYFCGACGERVAEIDDETRVRWRLPELEPDDTRTWFPFGAPQVAVRSGATLPAGSTSAVLDEAGTEELEPSDEPGFGDRPIQPGDSLAIELFCPQCGQRLGIPIARFLDDFACPRCGTVEQAANLVPRTERLVPAPATGAVVTPAASVRPSAAPVMHAPAFQLPEIASPSPAQSPDAIAIGSSSAAERRSRWARLLGRAAQLDELTRGKFGWSVIGVAMVVTLGPVVRIAALQHVAWLAAALGLGVVQVLVMLSRLRDDAGMITRRSAWSQLRPALGTLWSGYRAAWDSDASVFEASWKRVAPLFYVCVLIGAGAVIIQDLGLRLGYQPQWTANVEYFAWAGMTLALVHAGWQWRRRARARAGTAESAARQLVAGSSEAPLPALPARVFDLRRPDRARALSLQLGDCLLAHVVAALAAWPPKISKQARELEIQAALRRHLKRHLERALGPVGARCVHDRVKSVQDERTDRPGRADLQIENIMIEVKKALSTIRDRERALEQTSLYVRGWTLRTAEGAQRGPVLLVVTQADGTFENDFEQLLAAHSRSDLPYLIVAAGYR